LGVGVRHRTASRTLRVGGRQKGGRRLLVQPGRCAEAAGRRWLREGNLRHLEQQIGRFVGFSLRRAEIVYLQSAQGKSPLRQLNNTYFDIFIKLYFNQTFNKK